MKTIKFTDLLEFIFDKVEGYRQQKKRLKDGTLGEKAAANLAKMVCKDPESFLDHIYIDAEQLEDFLQLYGQTPTVGVSEVAVIAEQPEVLEGFIEAEEILQRIFDRMGSKNGMAVYRKNYEEGKLGLNAIKSVIENNSGYEVKIHARFKPLFDR